MLCTATGLSRPDVDAANALILLSQESDSYRKAGEAAAARFTRARHVVITDVLAGNTIDTSTSIIITIGTEAAQWARDHAPVEATIVGCLVADFESAGLTTGRTVHGVLAGVPAADQLALIREALPEARRIGVPFNPGSPRGQVMLDALRAAAGTQWSIETVEVAKPDAFADAVQMLIAKRVDIIWTMPDSSVYNQSTIRTLLQHSLRAKVPVYGFSVPLVKAGALLGAGVDPQTQGDQAAELALSIVASGTSSRRVENARHETAVNLAVAKQIGVRVSSSISGRATHRFTGE